MSLLRKVQLFSSSAAKILEINEANTARTTNTIVGCVQIVNPEGESIVQAIDYAHAELHKGNHYTTQHLFTGVANDANSELRILNGSTKELHMLIDIACEGKSYAYVYEGTTYTDNGTAKTAYNNKRNSANVTTATIYHTPIVNVLGTAIGQGELIPAGLKTNLSGATSSTRLEIVLKINTDYLIRVTSKAGAGSSIDTSIKLAWYEKNII